jgi:flagellar hook-length control protein FliK
VPSVNPIPFNEPRMQPASQPQPSGSDPFAELLASTAREETAPRHEPAAPKSRNETRTENLSRKDVKETKSVSERRETAAQPTDTESDLEGVSEGDTETAEVSSPSDDADALANEAETVDAPVVTETVEEAAAPAVAAGEAAPAIAAGEKEAGAEDGEAPDTAVVVDAAPTDSADAAVTDPEADTVPAQAVATPTAAPVVEDTVATSAEAAAKPVEGVANPAKPEQAAAPAPVAAPAADENSVLPNTAAAAQDQKPADVKPAHAAVPATPATTEPGEGVSVPATPATPATPTNKPAQAQNAPVAEQPQLTQAAVTETSSSMQGDGDNASSQKQSDSSANQAKAQDVKPATAEAPKAPAPAQDAAAPKVQPQVMPEAVRAVTNSFNTANVQTANFHATIINDRAPVPLNNTALAVEIVSRMNEGMRRFDIRLDPPELGRVDVRLEVDRNGNVSTKLTVDRPETLDLMQRDARHLERALQQAGLKTDGGGLEFSLRSHADQGGMADGHADRGGRERGASGGEDVERVELSVETYRSAALARGGVDIRI